MRTTGLQAFHKELVPRAATSNENLSFGQMTHSQCDLQGNVFHKGGQQIWHGEALQELFLVRFEELSAQ